MRSSTYTFYDAAHGNSMQQTSDGGYIICGTTVNGGDNSIFVLKTNSDGDSLWSTIIGDDGNNKQAYCVKEFDDGYIVGGSTDGEGAGGLDFFLAKLNFEGDVQWTNTYGGSQDDECYSVIPSNDGFIAVGYTKSESASSDIKIIKVNRSGDLLWQQILVAKGMMPLTVYVPLIQIIFLFVETCITQ